jgi:hypothetical protein
MSKFEDWNPNGESGCVKKETGLVGPVSINVNLRCGYITTGTINGDGWNMPLASASMMPIQNLNSMFIYIM